MDAPEEKPIADQEPQDHGDFDDISGEIALDEDLEGDDEEETDE